jgi:putative Ig domain-containing protein
MRFRISVCFPALFASLFAVSAAHAATIAVPAGGSLQAAIDQAQPGDVITLEPNATYVGNFKLPNKGALSDYITIRSAAPDSMLPGPGVRMTPKYAPQLPKIRSSNNMSALRTATGANHWKLLFLEFQANVGGFGDIVALGAGDSTQTMLSQVPYGFVIDRIYMHGDPVFGQKRGISLHSRDTEVINSYIVECKAIGQDSQAIGGFNGPGNFLIENNHLEASTENVLLGGSDPMIPNLVTKHVTVRYNHMVKPLAWRNPIMPTPTGVSAQAVPGGGSLPAGTYSYRIAARRKSNQNNPATSASSIEASATIAAGTTGGVTISWKPVSGAEVYLVYGRTPGGQTMYWKTTEALITDTGAAGTAVGTPSSVEKPGYGGTKWDVKNIFELKNAEDVLVEGNVFENLWIAGQSGYPILFTPRNQGKTAPWVVVQDVIFRYNIVRHTAGGVNILGVDNVAPTGSRLTNHINIHDNLFDDLTSETFGAAKAFQIGDGPEAVTINHNTIFTTDTTIVSFYGSPAMKFIYTNNMSEHRPYGLIGSGSALGLPTLTTYAPDAVICNNILAGGPASKYPGCNYFPSVAEWSAGFVNYAGGDYHLRPEFSTKYPSTDGRDLGPDIDVLTEMTNRAIGGGGSPRVPVTIATTSLPKGMLNQPYEAFVTCKGGGSLPCTWALLATSQLPAGIAFDAKSGKLFGTPTASGSGSVAVRAFDPKDPINLDENSFDVVIDAPALTVTYPTPSQGKAGIAFKLTPSVANAVGPTTVTFTGALPDGLGLNGGSGVIEGVPAKLGTWTATVQVRDSRTPAATQPATATVTIVIAPAQLTILPLDLPNGRQRTMYSAMLNATGGTAPYTWTQNSGTLPGGMLINGSGTISGVPENAGTFTFGVKVTDAAGTPTTTMASLTIQPMAPAGTDVVLYATDAPVIKGTWSLVDDTTAAGGKRIANADAAAAKLPAALAAPANYFEMSFQAQAGVGYHLWLRGKAAGNAWANDSAYVQFSGSVDANGAAMNRIGTAQGASVTIEEKTSAGVSEWGWADDSYGGMAGPVYFEATGMQTIRVQVREDGLSLDQIVLSADKYTAAAPGAAKNDATILPRSGATFRNVVLHAADATVKGGWSIVADTTAAGGRRLANPDAAAPKLAAPLAAPQNYFEMTFTAEAGVAYHLWVRGKAAGNSWANDSVYVQFSGSQDANGIAVNRIGSTTATAVSIEDGSGAGLSEWGWADDSYGGIGTPIYFAATGPQTIRVQVREDGVSLDQIVLSADRYATTAPGTTKNDTTVVPR